MSTTEAQQRTIETLMASPLAREALAAAEAERHERRRALLVELADAERSRETALAAAAAPLPGLRQTLTDARMAASLAAARLADAERELTGAEAASDSRVGALRQALADLGGDAIEAARRALRVANHAARNADDFRAVTTPTIAGLQHSTIHVDHGGAARLRRIGDALAELDELERDPEAAPASIEQVCAELSDEAGRGMPAPPAGAERVGPMGSLRDRAQAWLAKRMAAIAAAN